MRFGSELEREVSMATLLRVFFPEFSSFVCDTFFFGCIVVW